MRVVGDSAAAAMTERGARPGESDALNQWNAIPGLDATSSTGVASAVESGGFWSSCSLIVLQLVGGHNERALV